MRMSPYTSLSLVAALLVPGAALADGSRIELRNMAARVVVVTQSRDDVDVRVKAGDKSMPQITLNRSGGKVVVSGNLTGRQQSCGGAPGLFTFNFNDRGVTTVRVAGRGDLSLNDLPVVYIYAPQNLELISQGAVYGSLTEANQLRLSVHGCGDWKLGPVRGDLMIQSTGSGDINAASAADTELISAGSGDIRIGAVRKLKVSQSGSGDIGIGTVGTALSAATAGSGDINIGQINGPTEISVSGSGDVNLSKGRISRLKIAIAGSGDVHFGGEAEMVDAAIVGSGDISVARASGTVQKKVFGSGDISIGRQ